MAKNSLILLYYACLIITQVVITSSEDMNWKAAHDELRKIVGNLRKKCLTESGTTIELIENVELGEFPDDNKLACYFKCVMEKAGVMKKDSKINFNIVIKMMPQAYRQIATDMYDECRDMTGKDKCDLAYKFNKCMYKANPLAFFVV